jgi:uncharacterized protein with GYD domain
MSKVQRPSDDDDHWILDMKTLDIGHWTFDLDFLRRINMPTYIALMRWTEQGIAKVKDSPKRLDAGREAFKKLGVEIKDTYLTMGRYDLVCIIEGRDDDSVARALLTLGSQGNIQTETLKAWPEADYRKITGSL